MTEPDTSAYKESIAAVFTATSASHDTVGTVFSHFGAGGAGAVAGRGAWRCPNPSRAAA